MSPKYLAEGENLGEPFLPQKVFARGIHPPPPHILGAVKPLLRLVLGSSLGRPQGVWSDQIWGEFISSRLGQLPAGEGSPGFRMELGWLPPGLSLGERERGPCPRLGPSA